MLRKVALFLTHNPLTTRFLKGPAPQWAVLFTDIVLVWAAAMLTFAFNPSAGPEPSTGIFSIWAKSLTVTAIYAIYMLLLRTFRSVIRLSTIYDTYQVAKTVILASLTILLLDAVIAWTGHGHYIGTWNIFVLAVFAFAIMVTVRLMIKYLYSLLSAGMDAKRVVVLGSSISSFTLSSALLSSADSGFKPVLMLSTNSSFTDKTVNGIPIKEYNPETVAEIFKDYNADTLLLQNSEIDFLRNDAADVFLNNHINMMLLNQIESYDPTDNHNLSIKAKVESIRIEDLLGRKPIDTHNPAVSDSVRDRTVMITGAAGSIGSEITRQIAGMKPGRIVLVDQAETPMHELQLELERSFPNVRIKLCIADIANEIRMKGIFDRYRPQIVYHAAAYKHVPMMERNPVEAVQTNVFGTKLLADLSMRYGVECFVMISTDKAVNPTNIMGASKRIAEIYVQSLAMSIKGQQRNNTRFITTRFGNVLGSNGSVIPLFRRQIAEGGPVTVTHHDIIRYFMTIPEACKLVLEAGCMAEGGEIFIFDMGKPIRIYDLATRMIQLAGLKPGKDIEIVETGLRPGEKLYEELLNDHERTLPTHHSKIMIAKVRTYDYAEVCEHLSELHDNLVRDVEHDIVASMKRIVPEYKSQNSAFMAIDREISDDEVMHEINPNSGKA